MVDEDLSNLTPEEAKLRAQRLQEEGELRAMQDMFAGTGLKSELDGFVPKSKGDFERWGEIVAKEHVLLWHGKPGAHFKALVKALVGEVTKCMTLVELKELEKQVTDEKKRVEREDTERKQASTKKGQKKVAKANVSAGLDDDIYDDDVGDDLDFM